MTGISRTVSRPKDLPFKRIAPLPDWIELYPTHGAGSLCGRNISSETSSTIGQQRRFNYALRPMPREEFVRLMTADLPEAPAYFSRDARLNREGPGILDELPAPKGFSPRDTEARRRGGAIVLDTALEQGGFDLIEVTEAGLADRVVARESDPIVGDGQRRVAGVDHPVQPVEHDARHGVHHRRERCNRDDVACRLDRALLGRGQDVEQDVGFQHRADRFQRAVHLGERKPVRHHGRGIEQP